MQTLENRPLKIGIFRALQLGDLLCAIPAIRALRRFRRDANIQLIGLPWASLLIDRYPDLFDGFIPFPGYPGLPEQIFEEEKWDAFKKKMQAECFDYIIQMQGKGTIVNEMLISLNAGQVVGYHCAEAWMDAEFFLDYPNFGHEITRHLSLMKALGCKELYTDIGFDIRPQEQDAVFNRFVKDPQRPFIIVHPGSRGSWRQWPLADFARISELAYGEGLQVIITGSASEYQKTEELAELMHCPSTNLAGATSLGEMAALLTHSTLLVSNCTGVSHLSAATRTPSVVISLDGEPLRWGPLNTRLHTTIDGRSPIASSMVQADTLAYIKHSRQVL